MVHRQRCLCEGFRTENHETDPIVGTTGDKFLNDFLNNFQTILSLPLNLKIHSEHTL